MIFYIKAVASTGAFLERFNIWQKKQKQSSKITPKNEHPCKYAIFLTEFLKE